MNSKVCLVLSVLVACVTAYHNHNTVDGLTHGNDCNRDRHCTREQGLICKNAKCACPTGETFVTENITYDLEWSATKMKCVGVIKSACVGTKDNPATSLAVECTDGAVCEQVNSSPLSIGQCNADGSGKGGGQSIYAISILLIACQIIAVNL